MKIRTTLYLFILICVSCSTNNKEESYQHHVKLLKQHTEIIELISDNEQSRLVVAPEFQGRVITSTNSGVNGTSLGWLNTDELKTGKQLSGAEIH
ncbi:MAG: hypothetical protein MI740_08450, partial [Halanaerobiales bacterium]|nr:hypothetical protein [Halanaerobiales bacterium]